MSEHVSARTSMPLCRLDPRAFKWLPELRVLQLEDNGLQTLVNLGALPRLRSLLLAANRLADFSELDLLAREKLPSLQELTLRSPFTMLCVCVCV